MSKKILIISQNFYPEIGSAANRSKNIYQLLKKEGYNVSVLTTEPSYPNKKMYEDERFWDDETLNHDSQAIKRIKITNKKYSQSIFNRLIYYVEITIRMLIFLLFNKQKYDVIFVTTPPIFIGIAGLLAKGIFRGKLLLDIRDLWPESLKGVGVFHHPLVIFLVKKLEKLMYQHADSIIVNSKVYIDYIMEDAGIPKQKITFIPNGVRHSELEMVSAKRENKIVYAGNLGLAQDVQVLKELAKMLHNQNISMDIIGFGMKKEEFYQFVQEENLNNVRFFTPKTRKECLKLISGYQAGLVALTNNEVFEMVLPGKIIDYMTCGTPIVGAVSGYARDIICKEEAGFVSDAHNPNEMLHHILEIFEHADIQEKLSMNARNYVRSNFVWENNIKILVGIIESHSKDHVNEDVAEVKTG
ncbi:glycosyltransferase family 4 protein [Neobacillus sp. NPDC058068]|uniref:glycosyltransferase family 4 protein n=1 Tax=Neobacillus sp. NPDC058068 TaxID=3346325 RepID=UPI0036DCA2E5